MTEALMKVEGLSVSYNVGERKFRALRDVSMEIPRGSIVALVGESGSGKTTIVRTIMRVLPKSAEIEGGSILFEGRDLLKLDEREMEKIRGKKIAMVFQDPISHLNPVMTVREQIIESIELHTGLRGKEAEEEALRLLSLMRLKDPQRVLSLYPHQLSGGMAQRVLMAIALSSRPSLLIADEPTSALDPTVQVKILNLLKEIHEKESLTILMITHDFSVVAYMADYIYVIYGGRIMEYGDVYSIFKEPLHPYTKELLISLTGKGFDVMEKKTKLSNEGCPFAPRCPFALDKCWEVFPDYMENDGRGVACHAVSIKH
ncbi:MAG: ABC transporter ATP-binding protein [Fervidicoccaceae archaeon]